MEALQVFQQVIEFNKAAFYKGFSTMVMLQDNAESVYTQFFKQIPWIPKESENTMQYWTGTWKKGREEFKKLVEESFRKAELYFAETQKGQTESTSTRAAN